MRLFRLIVLIIPNLDIDLDPFRHEKFDIFAIIRALLIDPQYLLSQPFFEKVRILLHRFLEIDLHQWKNEERADHNDGDLSLRWGVVHSHDELHHTWEDRDEEDNHQHEDHQEIGVVSL